MQINRVLPFDIVDSNVLDKIKAYFTESIQTQIAAAEALPDAILPCSDDTGSIFTQW
jgi:hypothetical protein